MKNAYNEYREKFSKYDNSSIVKRFEDRVWLKNKLRDLYKKSTMESAYNTIGNDCDDSIMWFVLMKKRCIQQRNYSIPVENWIKCREVW